MQATWTTLLALTFAVPAAVSAANVSVMVIEVGAGAVNAEVNAESWENNMMDVFFNEGHIVSNAHSKRIRRLPTEEIPEEALRDLQAASEGGSEFFVIALLGYGEKAGDRTTMPETITLRLYNVDPYRYVREETITIHGGVAALDAAQQRMRAAVKNMIPYMRRR